MPAKPPATVSDEDIRRKYYESSGYSMWITEMQLDPLQLVVTDDASGKHYRVPVELKNGDFTFGDPVEVAVRYVDTAKAGAAIVFASRSDSLDGIEQAQVVTVPSGGTPGPASRETPAQAAARIHAAAERAASKTPGADTAAGPSHTEGAVDMPFDRDKIREALGLGPDATDQQITEAWASAWVPGQQVPPAAPEQTPPPATPANTPPAGNLNISTLAELAKAQGVILMDPSQVDEMRQMASRGQQAYNAQRASERDGVIDKAIETGRVALSRRDDWIKSWDAEVATGGDGSKTRELIESLTPNLVPMEAQGYASAAASSEADNRYYGLYPEDRPQAGGNRRG